MLIFKKYNNKLDMACLMKIKSTKLTVKTTKIFYDSLVYRFNYQGLTETYREIEPVLLQHQEIPEHDHT